MFHKFMVKAATVATLSVAALTVSGGTAFAQSGQISFTGSVDLFNAPSDPTNNTLYIDFLSPTMGGTGTLISVAGPTGVFSGIAAGTTAIVSDINVTPATTTALTSPFLSVGGYTFSNPVFTQATGGSFTYGSILLQQLGNNVSASMALNGNLTGAGLAAGTRFDGIFTTQFSGTTVDQLLTQINSPGGVQNQGISATFSYTVSTVPEPSTYALMGAGLAGLALVARRRRMTA